MTQAQSNEMRTGSKPCRPSGNCGPSVRGTRKGARSAAHAGRTCPPRPADAPPPLNANQIDPVSGELYWPAALLDDGFQAQRSAVDECAAKWVKYGGLDYVERTQVRENIDAMYARLKSQITSIPPQDYVAGRTFLESLLYATTRAVL